MANFATTNAINTNGVSAIPGQDNRDLGLKKLYSEVFYASFVQKLQGMQIVTMKTSIDSPFIQFPLTETLTDADVTTLTPGTEVTPVVQKFGEKVLKVQDLETISNFIFKLDQDLSQYRESAVTELAVSRANGLSQKIDKLIFVNLDKAVTTAVPGVGQSAASTVTNGDIVGGATVEDKGNALIDSVFDLSTSFDEKSVPEEGRIFVTTPRNYNLMFRTLKLINTDIGGASNGTIAGGPSESFSISGIKVIKTMNLPGTANVEGYLTTDRTVALGMAQEIESDMEWQTAKQGWLAVDSMAYAIDVLDTTTAGVVYSA